MCTTITYKIMNIVPVNHCRLEVFKIGYRTNDRGSMTTRKMKNNIYIECVVKVSANSRGSMTSD